MRGECFIPRAIDAYLIHRFLLDSVPKKIVHPSRRDDGRFYPRHADNKGDQILVDDDCNITGILDWEWAHTDTKSATFNSPVMLLPVAEFYDGKNQLGENELVFAQFLEEKGHTDLAAIVREDGFFTSLIFVADMTSLTGRDFWEFLKVYGRRWYKYKKPTWTPRCIQRHDWRETIDETPSVFLSVIVMCITTRI